MRKRLLLFSAIVFLRAAAFGEGEESSEYIPQRRYPEEIKIVKDETPLAARLILQPIKQGMFVSIPVVDADPNRGVTWGVMPIWVIRAKDSDRIQSIHAPSLTYNRHFKLTPTYRYYAYPETDATFSARASVGKYEHEVFAQYEDLTPLGTNIPLFARFQWNADAGQRYFGTGPDTPQSAETNYKQDYILTHLSAGIPLLPDSKWHARLTDRLISSDISNGPLPRLPTFDDAWPGLSSGGHMQANEMRVSLDYDSRDHNVTTRRGALLETFASYSVHGAASSYDFNRYRVDGRYFSPWRISDNCVTAAQVQFEQLYGHAPFWLLPSLGGKYSLRAYGDGRYVDRGMAAANIEQRITFYKAKMAGVTTEFEAAPFLGLGTVFDTPERASARYARPVIGTAVRAVARPQVVGSVDVGVGQQGVAVFTDINYSF